MKITNLRWDVRFIYPKLLISAMNYVTLSRSKFRRLYFSPNMICSSIACNLKNSTMTLNWSTHQALDLLSYLLTDSHYIRYAIIWNINWGRRDAILTTMKIFESVLSISITMISSIAANIIYVISRCGAILRGIWSDTAPSFWSFFYISIRV